MDDSQNVNERSSLDKDGENILEASPSVKDTNFDLLNEIESVIEDSNVNTENEQKNILESVTSIVNEPTENLEKENSIEEKANEPISEEIAKVEVSSEKNDESLESLRITPDKIEEINLQDIIENNQNVFDLTAQENEAKLDEIIEEKAKSMLEDSNNATNSSENVNLENEKICENNEQCISIPENIENNDVKGEGNEANDSANQNNEKQNEDVVMDVDNNVEKQPEVISLIEDDEDNQKDDIITINILEDENDSTKDAATMQVEIKANNDDDSTGFEDLLIIKPKVQNAVVEAEKGSLEIEGKAMESTEIVKNKEEQFKNIEDMLSKMDETQHKKSDIEVKESNEEMSSSDLFATLSAQKEEKTIDIYSKQGLKRKLEEAMQLPAKRGRGRPRKNPPAPTLTLNIAKRRGRPSINELNKKKMMLKKQLLERHQKEKYKAIKKRNMKIVNINNLLNSKESEVFTPKMLEFLKQIKDDKLTYGEVVKRLEQIKKEDIVKKEDPLAEILTKSGIIGPENDENEDVKATHENRPSYVLIIDNGGPIVAPLKKIDREKMKLRLIAFKRIVKNIKQVKLPSKDWQVKLGLSESNKVIQVTCSDVAKRKNVQISCFKAGYESIFDGRYLQLLGAPDSVETLQDLSILLNIVNGMSANDPLLDVKS